MGKGWQKTSLRSMSNVTNRFREQRMSIEVIFVHSKYFNAKKGPGVFSLNFSAHISLASIFKSVD